MNEETENILEEGTVEYILENDELKYDFKLLQYKKWPMQIFLICVSFSIIFTKYTLINIVPFTTQLLLTYSLQLL